MHSDLQGFMACCVGDCRRNGPRPRQVDVASVLRWLPSLPSRCCCGPLAQFKELCPASSLQQLRLLHCVQTFVQNNFLLIWSLPSER